MSETERVARLLAARKMGLVKDPRGERLPEELWGQCVPDAALIVRHGLQHETEVEDPDEYDHVDDARRLAALGEPFGEFETPED